MVRGIVELKDIQLFGEIINMRLISEKDAGFVVSLRNDENLNKYISQTSASIDMQVEWIRDYKSREAKGIEFYFIVENKDGENVGTVRIYDIDHDDKTCIWGSFILSNTRPNGSSYEVIRLSTEFAFKNLSIDKIYLDVRKNNSKAIHIYKKYGFVQYSANDIDLFFCLKSGDANDEL